MKRITWVFWGCLAVLTGLWLMADTLLPAQRGYFDFRTVWVQYTGVIAMGVMSLAMVLAVRPVWLERHLDGLDKMYRLHKWLGIGALVVGTVHWLWAKGTKWAVGWGWLTKPARGAGGGAAELGAIEAALRGWRGTAETMGEWVFYGAVLLIVLALVKRFPYRLFAKTHKLLAVAYLVLVFHTVVLTKIDYWAQPVGWVQAVLLVAGTVSAVIVLLGRIGARRTAHGTIESLERFPTLHMLETTLLLDERWAGHQPGQFAFLTSSAAEGAHPYTIASAWNPQDRRISFVTKALGDHTGTLHERLRVGDRVKIEGPYGHFTFEGDAPQQIWIGAGIGITPFIARMKHLAQAGARGPTVVDLFHPTAAIDPAALQKLQANARAAGVRLHLLVDGQDERLTGERLRQMVPGWKNASVWFCGPAGFGQALRADLTAQGLPDDAFHQELFQMR